MEMQGLDGHAGKAMVFVVGGADIVVTQESL
jgi:hypothetical protein